MKSNDNYRGHTAELREAQRIARQHDVERRIQEENEQFSAMTPAQKRVRIAKDVLEWIAVGRLVPENMNYISVVDERDRPRRSPSVNGFTCHACALGAVFAVAVERGGVRAPGGNLGGAFDFDMRHRLAPYFEETQLRLIEDAFEGFACCDNKRASNFCDDIPKKWDAKGNADPSVARLRMERIMRNIIANNGTFIP